jgi:hypothetical protein
MCHPHAEMNSERDRSTCVIYEIHRCSGIDDLIHMSKKRRVSRIRVSFMSASSERPVSMEFRGSTTLIILAIPSGKPLNAVADVKWVVSVGITGQRGTYISHGDLGHRTAYDERSLFVSAQYWWIATMCRRTFLTTFAAMPFRWQSNFLKSM